jgi:hypothetical protein
MFSTIVSSHLAVATEHEKFPWAVEIEYQKLQWTKDKYSS